MGILFWYILRQYLRILVMCITGLTSIYLVIDFFEKLRKFIRYDAELTSMLMYFFFKIPEISFTIAPLAALMASLLVIGFLKKSHEITAMRSSGFSLLYFSAPFLFVSSVATVIFFGFTAIVIPLGNAKAEQIKIVEIQKKPQPLAFTAKNLWLRIQDNTIMNVKAVSPDGAQLQSIHLYRLNSDFQLHQMLSAETVDYEATGWTLKHVVQRTITPKGPVTVAQHERMPLELSLTPEDLKTWISLEPEHMTLGQLRDHITHLENEGHNITRFLTDYWGRIAFSAVTLIMTILGLSLGLRGLDSRTSSMAINIGLGLGIGLVFWATHSVGISLGRSGALLPVIAGWIACIMFLLVSLNFFLRVRY